MLRNLHVIAIALILLFFLQVPLGFIAFSGAAGVLFSLILLTPLIVLQVLTLKALQRRFPSNPTAADVSAEATNEKTDHINKSSPDSRQAEAT